MSARCDARDGNKPHVKGDDGRCVFCDRTEAMILKGTDGRRIPL